MDEQQLQEQIVLLVQDAMQGDQEATQKIQQIMLAAQLGDLLAVLLAQMIQQVAQLMQQVQSAKFGAKLNYVKQLKGKCPIGYEMRYYKVGGKLCSECIKEEKESKKPLNSIDAFKCGRKMKKKACGGSVKKDQRGGPVQTAESANERYKGGTYRGPRKLVDLRTLKEVEGVVFPKTEYIVGPDLTFNWPASMTLKYNSTGDSTITEVPPHFVNISDSWWLPNSVKILPRTATNRGDNLQEWQTMKKRWELAKKVTR